MKTRGFFGIDGLDQVVPQGMEYGSQILVYGDTGVGKTILAGEFLKEGLLCGDISINPLLKYILYRERLLLQYTPHLGYWQHRSPLRDYSRSHGIHKGPVLSPHPGL